MDSTSFQSKIQRDGHHDGQTHSAAAHIQKIFHGYKKRKEFLAVCERVVKIQAHFRGYKARKLYKNIVWSVRLSELLGQRGEGTGLRGFHAATLNNASSTQGTQVAQKSRFKYCQLLQSGLPMSMRWNVLALVLRARAKIKVFLNEVRKSREKMKLYCYLFPHDYEFESGSLVQLWMAMRFSRQRDEEDFYKRYFDILVKEQFILFSKVDVLTSKSMYKVDHDKIKALVDGIQTTENEDLYAWLEDETTVSSSLKSWHLSLVSQVIRQTTFEKLRSFSGLRTLLFVHNYGSSLQQIPSEVFLSFDLLQALDLSGSDIIELPRSIGNMRQLRYLNLSFTLIASLPGSIGRLCQLQTLKLQGCKHLCELPKGITGLICLHHLDFDVLGQLSYLPKGIGALIKLRTLSAFVVDDSEEGCSIKELKNMNSLRGRCCISGLENVSYIDIHEAALQDKKHLTHLQLRWNDLKLYSAEDQIDAYNTIATLDLNKGLEELQIISYPGLKLPAWINLRHHEKLVSITLFNCGNECLTCPLGLLPNLKYLDIIHMNGVIQINSWFRGGYEAYAAFPKLEKLKIDCMQNIKMWTGISRNDFRLLSKLIIKQCPNLIGIPFLPHLRSLKHLEISRCIMFECLPDGIQSRFIETLIIDECPLLKNRCSKDGKDWYKVRHVPNIWIDLEDICYSHEDGGDDNNSLTGIAAEDKDQSTSSPHSQKSCLGVTSPFISRSISDNSLSPIELPVSEIELVPALPSTRSKGKFRGWLGKPEGKDKDKEAVQLCHSIGLNFQSVFSSGSWNDIGPRQYMEDESVCIDNLHEHLDTSYLLPSPAAFYGVFDGRGGTDAAYFVCQQLLKYIVGDQQFPLSLEEAVKNAFVEVDYALADSTAVNTSSGTTALIAIGFGRTLLVANAGDCRAVLGRRGKAIELSKDHRAVYPSERLRIERLGGVIENGYLNGKTYVSRALGHWDIKGRKGSSSPLIAEPELQKIDLTENDEFVILASDGLWDVMSSKCAVNLVRRELMRHSSPQKCSRELVTEALRLNSFDNVTVIVICFWTYGHFNSLKLEMETNNLEMEMEMIKGILRENIERESI